MRKAYDLLTTGFGAGFNGPIPIVVEQGTDQGAAQKVYVAAQKLPESAVAFVQTPIFNDAKDVGLVMITPATAPQSDEDGRPDRDCCATTSCRTRSARARPTPT